jgi:SAM-dependent methyltransferase
VDDPKQIVACGYDSLSGRFEAWAAGVRRQERRRYISLLIDGLPEGGRILDLGCNNGALLARRLAGRFRVTGVDISARSVEEARRNIPSATFIRGDMTRITFPTASFDAVAAFYSLIHIPPEELPPLLGSIAAWLRPDGRLVASLGRRPDPGGVQEDFLGVRMYFGGYDGESGERLVERAGLEVVGARAETADEDGRPITFLWIVAEKPGH